MEEAKEELFNIIGDEEMRHVPVVLLANKQDLPGKVLDIKEAAIEKIMFHCIFRFSFHFPSC